jgi:hypothetical protein
VGAGEMYFLTAAEIADLVALFAGEMDVVRCDACNERLPIHPTVIVALEYSPRFAVLIGSVIGERGNLLVEQLASDSSVTEDEIVRYSSPEELRDGLRKHFKPAFATAKTLVTAARSQNAGGWIQTNWRALTPTVFSAGRIYAASLTAELSSRGKDTEARSGLEALLRLFASAQAKTWLALSPRPLTSHMQRLSRRT